MHAVLVVPHQREDAGPAPTVLGSREKGRERRPIRLISRSLPTPGLIANGCLCLQLETGLDSLSARPHARSLARAVGGETRQWNCGKLALSRGSTVLLSSHFDRRERYPDKGGKAVGFPDAMCTLAMFSPFDLTGVEPSIGFDGGDLGFSSSHLCNRS